MMEFVAIGASLVAVAAGAWGWQARQKARLLGDKMQSIALQQAARNLRLMDLEEAERKRQNQRIQASRRAAELAAERAEERRRKRTQNTTEALATTRLRPRQEVVADIVDRRRTVSNSGAGMDAKAAG